MADKKKKKIAAAKKKALSKSKAKPKAKKKAPAKPKNPQPYKKDDVWYDAKGKEIKHQGTINLLEKKKDFPKGVSGNPNGRPKGRRNRSTILKDMLELNLRKPDGGFVANPLDPDQNKITAEQAIAAALIKKALTGNVPAIREIQDTVYGKIKDRVEFSDAPTIIRDDIPDDD